MSCVDRKVLDDQMSFARIMTLPNAIEIRGLGSQVHHASQYVVLTLYVPGYLKNGQQVFGEITKEFHIVENLSCNMLLGVDVIEPAGSTIDLQKRVASVRACQGMTCPLRITPRGPAVMDRAVSTAKDVLIDPHTSRRMPVKMRSSLPPNRDYRFNAFYNSATSYLALHGMFPEAIFDDKTDSVVYYNTSDAPVRIRKNQRIGTITDWDLNDRITEEPTDVVNAMFAFTKYIPSVSTCMKFGLTALQCAQVFLTKDSAGTELSPAPDTFVQHQASVYSLCRLGRPLAKIENEALQKSAKERPRARLI